MGMKLFLKVFLFQQKCLVDFWPTLYPCQKHVGQQVTNSQKWESFFELLLTEV